MARRAGLAVLLSALALAAACSGDGGGGAERDVLSGRTAPTTTSTTVDPDAPPLVTADLVIRDQGFSTFPDPVDPTATLGGYGVVVENPNPEALATGVTVHSQIVGADGTVLFQDTALLNGVMPGQQMAVGGTLLEPIVDPVRLDVTIGVSAWLRPAHDASLTAEGVVTEPEPGGGAITRFSVLSSWPVDEEGVDVTSVYRAADGRILAGEQSTLASVPAGGSIDGSIRLLAPIPELAGTEVYVGRGFSAQMTG